MDYLAVKHTHMAIAVLSIVLFYLRSFSRLGSGAIAKNKLVFIGSHATDTFLLISAFALMAIAKINPLEQTWLLEKIILVVAYIALGIIASKQQKTSIKIVFLVVTTVVIAFIGKLAVAKTAFIL
ncbi:MULTISPECIES: SirB2 family protein [Pseudoalteromonas]|uniref:SirB2 family protein n=1 Tax=Pseudoalteromonas rhizosphaerae TaxID=2518973 RepID=A0ABW8KRQ0_9GAMM|nr:MULTISPECIES: SirB2 family protein [unclassified Pseudoalteromonas]MBB1335011.1 SirB2 family protein [Pseudoalteromonas sp. SR41-6]MBB1342906.1 SirB2 family protein [Pseudoalteromonas sp. SR45-6]MBB1418698.1 SirB2 family protein [Pseudoalteromonas sp. SG44-1]MBB1434884.1 SirB2 family protein [Pseudoalteromonas sp. SG43-6]MBB1460328.1 SirB2 family protein [Pseudoalteromonas sp. SG41-8]